MTSKKTTHVPMLDGTTAMPLSVVWVMMGALFSATVFSVSAYSKLDTLGKQIELVQATTSKYQADMDVLRAKVEVLQERMTRLESKGNR